MPADVELSENALLERIEQRRGQCRRARSSFTVLQVRLVDAAGWRALHDGAVASALLAEMKQRLRSRIRDSDELLPDAGAGHAVLLPGAGPAEAAVVRARLQASLADAFLVGGRVLHPAVSVEVGPQSIFEPACGATAAPAGPRSSGPQGGQGCREACRRSSLAA